MPRLAWLALSCALACGERPPTEPPETAGTQLLARIETRLERERDALEPRLSHYGLVYPVEPEVLRTFMRRIRVHGEGTDLALGSELALELHGGGVLRVLFDYWRPTGRLPRLDDRYPLEASASPPTLGELYEAGRDRLFLPVLPEASPGSLPRAPRLPRMRTRFGLPGGPVREVETDAFMQMSLMLELEPDLSRTWHNAVGQPLSVSLLMRHVRDSYLTSPAHRVEPEDHTELHLVELLVAHARRDSAQDLAPVQRHFLEVELAARSFEPADEAQLLGHSVESLGWLLAAPTLAWNEVDAARVRHWLSDLEQRLLPRIEREGVEALCHLAHGLRAVREQRGRLE